MARKLSIKIEGDDILNLKQEQFVSALAIVAEEWLTQIKDTEVPVDRGWLKASGRVDHDAATDAVAIVFGNNIVPYAVPVHERTHVHHDVGKAKYVTDFVNAHRADLASDVMALVREMAGG